MKFATAAIHAGNGDSHAFNPVVQPIYQSATFGWESLDKEADPMYTRYGNPNRRSLELTLASLENGTDALCLASGMAAVTTGCSILRPGDHVICSLESYGGTYKVLTQSIAQQGIEVSFCDMLDPNNLKNCLQENTKIVWLESPSNPVLNITDIRACAKLAHDAGALAMIDNTFASPFLQNPLDLGCDAVMHSTTKSINGHTDVVAGALIWNDADLGSKFLYYAKMAGNTPAPFDCWLISRGVKSLAVRMSYACNSAASIAAMLANHPKVAKTHFPGLSTHPQHELAKNQMRGFGSMVSFVVDGGEQRAKEVAHKLKFFAIAASLGGIESLVGYPPVMSHAMLSEEERIRRGIEPGLLRLSIGLEDTDDLLADLNQALN